MDNDKPRTPKTLGFYIENNPLDIIGKTFQLEGTETTQRFDTVYPDQNGHFISEGYEFFWFAGGTSNPETIDLTEAREMKLGLLSAIELIEGVNARKSINPVAVEIMNYYEKK